MAHFRESNAKFLEILEPPIAAGVPIELDIFDGSSPATLLATLENAKDIALQQELNKPGSASFRINRHDPKATAAIVDRENLAKLKVGGRYRFSFWMRERKIEVLQEGEEEAEYWIIGGPGALQYVDRAEMWTESYIGDDPIEGVWDLGNAFGGNSVGQMARRVLDESLAKTPSPIGFLTTNWNYDVDSQGNLWSDSADLEVNVGDNVLDVLGLLTGLGLDIRMRHDLLLEAFVELGRHYDVDSGPELPVVFRGGQNITTSLSRRSQGGIASRALVKGAGDAIVEVSRLDIEADPYVGRREIFLSVSNAKDATTMQRAGEAELAGRLADTEAISFGVRHGSGPGEYEPWVNYDIGDWITLDEPGVYDLATYRIVGWSIKQSEDDYDVFLDCNSVEYEDLLKLARKAGLDKAGASGGGSSTVGSGTSGGGGGGGGTTSSSKVAVELGDGAGYLYDKLQAGDGIVKTLVGASGSRKVELSLGALGLDDLADVDLSGLSDGDGLVWDATAGLFVPGAAGGGGGVPDMLYERPGSAHALDDEFSNGALDAAWTLVRPGSPRTTWTERGHALSVFHSGGGGTTLEAAVRSLGGRTFPLTIETCAIFIGYGNYPFVGPVFANGAAHGSGIQVIAANYNRTTATYRRMASWTSEAQNGGDFGLGFPVEKLWHRFVWISANTFRYLVSPDGISWIQLGSDWATNVAFTPTHAGVYLSPWSFGNPWAASFELFRVYDVAKTAGVG